MEAVVTIMGNKSSSMIIDDLVENDEMQRATQVLGKSFDALRSNLSNCGVKEFQEIAETESDKPNNNRQSFANIKGNRKKGW